MQSADADTELARADLERAKDLAGRKVVSKAELDAADRQIQTEERRDENMRALIGKKTIRAPFDGAAGIRTVNVGQTIKEGAEIVPLAIARSGLCRFRASSAGAGASCRRVLKSRVTTDAAPGQDFEGKLTAMNSMVDSATRNVTLQATLRKPGSRAATRECSRKSRLCCRKNSDARHPGLAVSYAPYGDSVFVIEKKKDEKTGKESQASGNNLFASARRAAILLRSRRD